MATITVREAVPRDAANLSELIFELATYEKRAEQVTSDPATLATDLAYDASPRFYCLIAESGDVSLGYAAYYFKYSTFGPRWHVYLEDIYVRERVRNLGVARALLAKLAEIALDQGSRMYFSVLTWNTDAKAVYEKLGAKYIDEWDSMFFDEAALRKLLRH